MSFVVTKGTDDEDATDFAYVARAYACVAIVKTRLNISTFLRVGHVIFSRECFACVKRARGRARAELKIVKETIPKSVNTWAQLFKARLS